VSVYRHWRKAIPLWHSDPETQSDCLMKRRLPVPALIALATIPLAACSGARQAGPPVEVASRTPDVVFVPTPHRVVDQMLAVARVDKGDVLYDLGSGDGRIVVAAAKRFGIRAVGIDIDPKRIEESWANADTAGVRALVDFRNADLFTTDLRPATVVTLYLLPALNVRLRPKLFEELAPGARIVSHSFDMGDWKADSTLAVDARVVYYWIIPADVSGRWKIIVDDQPIFVDFEQKYQQIISARQATSQSTVEFPVVRGDSVRFSLRFTGNQTIAFRGRVSGDSIIGSYDMQGSSGSFTATRVAR
jgi:hypothetical protein